VHRTLSDHVLGCIDGREQLALMSPVHSTKRKIHCQCEDRWLHGRENSCCTDCGAVPDPTTEGHVSTKVNNQSFRKADMLMFLHEDVSTETI